MQSTVLPKLTVYIKYNTEKQTHAPHAPHTPTPTPTHTHTMTVTETGY